MKEMFQDAFRRARTALEELMKVEERLSAALKSDPAVAASREETADAAYALREAEALYDQARKKARAMRELAEKMCCMVSAVTENGECVRTPYVTAVPMVRTNVAVPSRKKDFEGFRRLMNHLGVPDDMLGGPGDDEHAAVDVHWPGLMNLLARQQAEGKPLPPGVDPSRTVASYSLTIRKKKGVTE